MDDEQENSLGLDSFQTPWTDEGLSLDSISQAFAEMLATGDDPYTAPPEAERDSLLGQAHRAAEISETHIPRTAADGECQINPRSIIESVLFVGTPDHRPLTAEQMAGMMRGVRPLEIDELVADLNRQYAEEERPYRIAADGAGYRLALREQFEFMRERLYGRPRAARLSPAAVEVLAIVAYNEPVTAEQVAQMRGTASGPVLAQLVRRELLRIERGKRPEPTRYFTTPRFLHQFGLSSLQDLPRSCEVE